MSVYKNECKQLSALNTIVDAVVKIQKEDGITLYFRGESKEHDYLIPNLYGKKEWEQLIYDGSEEYYRSLFAELGQDDYTSGTSLFRHIAEFQHYGAKSRLLDLSTNMLVSLYFAVEKDDDKDGYLYIFSNKARKEKFDSGHTVAIKSALNLIPQNLINDFLMFGHVNNNYKCYGEECTTSYIKNHIVSYEENGKEKKVDVSAVEKFMDHLNQRARVREPLEYPIKVYRDITSSHIVLPGKCTERIRQQQGAFIMPAYVSTVEFDSGEKRKLKDIQMDVESSVKELLYKTAFKTRKNKNLIETAVIIIPKNSKRTIRENLIKLGINSSFIYPGIESTSNFLLR